MSHLNEMKTCIRDKEMLVKALCKHMHLTPNQIEVHDKAQPIIGYHGTNDKKIGHVIVRKGNSGIPSDIGWELKGDTYVSHVDSFDYTQGSWNCKIRLDEQWNLGLQQTYNHEVIKQGLTDQGKEFVEATDKDGYPMLRIKYQAEEKQASRIQL